MMRYLLFLSLFAVSYSTAKDIHVKVGESIAQAIKLAGPGDTIHLEPGTWYESATFHNKHGEPGKPITLDGHGATINGSEPVTTSYWQETAPGLYKSKDLYPKTTDAMVARWYLLWDGKMQRMNRCSKGPTEPLKDPAELQPGEWTYVKEEDSFYLKIEPGTDLAAANIRYPARSNAVAFGGAGSWITIKNIIGTHVYNDGFNIHGAQRNLVFENIQAIECGDDGFSAHEDADCRIDGFVSKGNATGLCDTGTSRTWYKNVSISDCDGYDLYFIGLEHSLENAEIESRAAKTFALSGDHLHDGARCRLTMKNVTIRRAGETTQELRISRRGTLYAADCRFEGLNTTITPGGSAEFERCQFEKGNFEAEIIIFPAAIWLGRENRFDIKSLRIDHRFFTPETFSNFQRLTGTGKGSVWE